MNELKEKTIGVFFGGQSPEHEISIITGEFVIAELKRIGYSVVAVYVDKKGQWYAGKEISELKFFKEKYQDKLDGLLKYSLNLSKSKKKLILESGGLFGKKEIQIDFVFPTFHGLGGEDGSAQGLFEFFQVPYAGCGIHASSIAIDKTFTKKFLNSLNIPTTDFLIFNKEKWESEQRSVIENIKNTLKFPIFVKPARSGSSIGISKVKSVEELEEAMNLGFYYDVKVVVENGVENVVDLTCAVLSDGKSVLASEVQESVFESDLFDYSVKYLKDGGAQTGNAESSLIIPANIDDKFTDLTKKYAKEIFVEIDGNGTARIDFLLNKKTGELFANEINTLPGTLYHHLWEKTNVKMDEVLDKMITDGMKRWNDFQKINVDFETDVLNNANQLKLQNKK